MAMRPQVFRPASQVTARQLGRESDIRRGSARARGYTRRWDKASSGHRAKHPLCRGCEARGEFIAATVTDHVEPHRGDMVKFWNSAMWQSACGWCHSVLKQRLEVMFEQSEIVVADLWLDSAIAIRLGRQLRG